MALERLSLVLDSPEATFWPGDVVAGKVVVGLNTDQRIRGVYVDVKGSCEVSWFESESRTDDQGQTETVQMGFSARRTTLEHRVTLVGGAGQQPVLPAGEHAYHFRTTLPRGIPPSYEGAHGHVRYTVRALLDRPYASDHGAETTISVGAVVDLKLLPGLGAPVRELRDKTLCCLWCRSGPLTLEVGVPATGFVPGERVPVSVDVDNATSARVLRVVCRLTQTVLFHATYPSNKTLRTRNKMASVEFGHVEPRESATWTRDLRIPGDLPPTGLPHCSSTIQLSYCLEVKAEVSGPHQPHAVEIPVVVGTEPLAEAATYPVMQPTVPPASELLPPPPSYEETVYGSDKLLTHYPPAPQKI